MTTHKEQKEDKEEVAPVHLPDPDITAAHASVTLLERLAERLGSSATVTAVYGEPVTTDGVTVIPVAKVAFGLGGGAGRAADGGGGGKAGDGGGGGGGVEAKPLGYIEIRNGTSTYRPIRDTWGDIVLPLTALLLGTALPKAIRTLRRRS
ncbi:spore germination protein GerW family protein [Streptomyces sp. HD]|uniref:spore germination protein GerW family protein n=1 Tax=Streptomyces sp. HD TaxID=3020892 RepID=UPI00232DDC8F|nr:spore germination protein GerW family protein [Streptomyces sp. HD]MDC0771240.1 spore germination protein GerW family protein [Streptomyces sp. HD]